MKKTINIITILYNKILKLTLAAGAVNIFDKFKIQYTHIEILKKKTSYKKQDCDDINNLYINLHDFIKTPKNFTDKKEHFSEVEAEINKISGEITTKNNNDNWNGGSRSKSKFSRKRQHRHLSGKNRKHTLKRLHKKQKTNKNRNGNNIRKKTLKRN